MLALRGQINARSGDGPKLSINDFIIKATALALQTVPDANAGAGDAAASCASSTRMWRLPLPCRAACSRR